MVRVACAVVVVLVMGVACGPPATRSGVLKVVAGESFWASIAAQLGGFRVSIHSVVSDPNADPHEYEATPADARDFAEADLVILNGAGYDGWGTKLLAASPSQHREVIDVAQLLGKKAGDNPHFWYDPAAVVKVADSITARYAAIDPAMATKGYFDLQRDELSKALAPYMDEIATVKQKYGGAAIGATESIFVYMAAALSLNLTTPSAFMDAIAEGNDPPAAAVAEFHDQIAGSQIKVLIYNVQTATAVTTDLKALAAAHHIPAVGVSETLQPQNATFQDWQLAQLKSLESALAAS
ncbi:MAG TPA: zinc ABC transporter substrate-binding protein [Verrucomicrobiae bacterium]|nr:zinc ABC transporter substrate-binding protein [Verrucomicrobiae bacterium]